MPSMLEAKKNLKAIIPQSSVKTVRKLAVDLGFRLWQAMLAEVSVLENPIFIIGCPRCGTSIAVRLFALQPQVAKRTEAGLIWDPEHYSDPEVDPITEEIIQRLHTRFAYYRRREKKKRLINKHPRNSVRMGRPI